MNPAPGPDSPPHAVTAQRFRDAVALTPVAPQHFDLAFEATTQYVPWPKAYGGDLVAQSLAALQRSVEADRTVHSMHSFFMRPAAIGEVVRYEVETLRDGRGYSTRGVRAYQGGKTIFAGLASFQVPESGPQFSADAPAVPGNSAPLALDPESLRSAADVLRGHDGAAAEYWSAGRSFDMRHVPEPLYLNGSDARTGERPAAQAVWIRAFDALGDDPAVHREALAYVCDYTILEPALRARGLTWSSPGLATASLDHSLWFHRDGRLDDWVLYAQEAVSVQSNRGLNTGRFYARDGTLLATVAQEGMIRG
ncbi:thioesterase family protein [Micrococcales bacterium 31B]|nr:thioesterase family protein [Micrococcales bacterium 31B]